MAVLLAGGGALGAETSRPSLVVLDLEPKGATALQADAATQNVVRGLRELDVFQVLSSADMRQLLALERTRQLSGADTEGMSQLAQVLGARNVVAGTVTKLGNGLQVELRLLDTAAQKVLAQKAAGPATMEQLAGLLPGLAQELVAPLLQEQQGLLVVRTKEEAAEVVLDDVLVASTPMKTPIKVSRGAHRLQVRKDGFIAESRTTRITPDQLTLEEFTLVPSADYAEAYKLRHERTRTGAWFFTGATVVGIGGAILIDRLFTDPTYQHEFVPRQKAVFGVVPKNLPTQFKDDAAWMKTYNDCGANPADCQQTLQTLQGQLLLGEALTIGLAMVGAVSAGLASYLWLTGQDPNRYANLVATVTFGPEPTFVLVGRF